MTKGERNKDKGDKGERQTKINKDKRER